MPDPFCVVGSGPAGLLAADFLSRPNASASHPVYLFERRPAPGWKLLVAGSSGLNVTHADEPIPLAATYREPEIRASLDKFSREDWLQYLTELGEETFLGSSRRFFLRNPKATSLLAKWVARLERQGVKFFFGEEWSDFSVGSGGVELEFSSGRRQKARAALLALGGPSWEKSPPAWPEIFRAKGLAFTPFAPANAGYSFRAPPDFFLKAAGLPIKGLRLTTAKGEKVGECMITHYGLEGTPIYTLGCPGPATLDLKPDLAPEKLLARLTGRDPLAGAKLSPGARMLVEALSPPEILADRAALAQRIKSFPLELLAPRSLEDCISAAGGLRWEEIGPGFSLKKFPGIFCAGEMLDWEAPTGGYLLQACVSMGYSAAQAMLRMSGMVSP